MVVHDDDPRGRLRDRRPKDFARVHERAVQDAPRNEQVTQDLALAPQRQHVKFLHRQIPQPGPIKPLYVRGAADALRRRLFLGSHAPA